MSPTQSNEIFHGFSMHRPPPYLSVDEFGCKVEALMDEVIGLPVVQANLVKLDIIFQTDIVGDRLTAAFGFPPREPAIFIVVQSEILAAPEVRNVMAKGKEFGFYEGSSASATDLSSKVEAAVPEDGIHLFCVYNVPPELSATEEHGPHFEAFIDDFLRVPAVKKIFLRFWKWQYNDSLDDNVRDFGYSAGRTLLCYAVLEMMGDPIAQRFVLNSGAGGKHFDLKKHGYVFVGNVVKKLDKANLETLRV
ncbi:hypothetical protein R3P38DRAFT_3331936 [Favolaschia claudopus]|uniref:Uncharacterized protein n=1 Tax=Favolaschia claudopus TaxID=2862362 RepID=A0AAV9ZR80_9AGAR